MFKKLVLALRKCDFETAKGILRKSLIHDLIEDDTWVQGPEGIEATGHEEKSMEILSAAIYRHVNDPDTIYELMLAGMSPALLTRIFVNDPYRLTVLRRLLPVLAPTLEHDEKLERINDAGGINSFDDNRTYSAIDLVSRCALGFPVIYNNSTNELQTLIHALYVKDIKIADDTNHHIILDELLATINLSRAAENKPELNAEDNEEEIYELTQIAKEQANAALEKEFKNIYFAFEVYAEMIALGVSLQSQSGFASVRALHEYSVKINIEDVAILTYLICNLAVTYYLLFNEDVSLNIKTLAFALQTSQTLAWYKSYSNVDRLQDTKPKFNTLYSLYQTESYPFASKSSGMIENVRVRHQAKDAADFENKIDKGLYFWRKIIAPLPQSETSDNTPVIQNAFIKRKPG